LFNILTFVCVTRLKCNCLCFILW